MATQKYIGARYMPKFMGTYDATTAYEALSVVDNGSGTTYVANKPVPAGTALNNTEYWSVYGASSGAILDLQNRMSTAEQDIIDLAAAFAQYHGNLVIVGRNCKYTSIGAAISAVRSDVSLSNPYCIAIMSGVYDEDFDLRGLSGLTFLGLGYVQIAHTSTYPKGIMYIDGKITLINLHLVQHGDAYCIHADPQGTTNVVDLTAIECRFQRTTSGGTYQHCIGWGANDAGGDSFNIIRCDFIGSTGIGGHNNPSTDATGNIGWRICGCTFDVSRASLDWGDACKILNGTANAQHLYATFIGNSGNKGVYFQPDSGHTYNHFTNTDFVTVSNSSGNNIPALNGFREATVHTFSPCGMFGTTGVFIVPCRNANKYDAVITAAQDVTLGTSVLADTSIAGTLSNGFVINILNATADKAYSVSIKLTLNINSLSDGI